MAASRTHASSSFGESPISPRRPVCSATPWPSTTLNTALPDSQKKYSAQGFGYVGAPNYAAGFALASEAAKRANLQAGDIILCHWGRPDTYAAMTMILPELKRRGFRAVTLSELIADSGGVGALE